MFSNIPHPIQITFWKYLILYSGIGVLGIALGCAAGDIVFLVLSGSVMGLGTWKALQLLQSVKNEDFRVLEGTVLSDSKLPLRNFHALVLVDNKGESRRFLIAGTKLLVVNKAYRIYLLSADASAYSFGLPDVIAPAQTILGQEELAL